MTIPTPSAIAKQATQRKQLELQQEAERTAAIEALEKKLDADSRSKSDRVRASRASHSSKKVARGTSSPSAKPRTNETESETTGTKTPGTPPDVAKKASSTTVKKTFVRKPHLTQRLSDNEALLQLKESLPVVKHPNRSSTRSKPKSAGTVPTTQRRTERSSKQK